MMRFSLDFLNISRSEKILFPLPQSNQYQQITALLLPNLAERLGQKNGPEVAVFFPGQLEFSFKYCGQAVKTDWSQIHFKKYEQSPYFNQDYFINRDDLEMQTLAEEWLAGETDLKKVVRLLYENTLAYLKYGQPIRDLHPYTQALTQRETDCGGFSTFLATLLQAQGLPSRLVLGYLLKDKMAQKIKKLTAREFSFHDLSMHAWLEVQVADGSWLPLDGATDWRYRKGLSQRQASLNLIPADRLVLSYGHNQELNYQGKKYRWPIWQHPEIIKADEI